MVLFGRGSKLIRSAHAPASPGPSEPVRYTELAPDRFKGFWKTDINGGRFICDTFQKTRPNSAYASKVSPMIGRSRLTRIPE
jgi:hypothetical protein